MKLNQLVKTKTNQKKRVGRGYGSGKGGHTVGRGQKGQKSRGKVKLLFEGTKMRKSLIKRLPMRRGKDRFKSFNLKPLIINVKYLNLFDNGSQITVKSLVDKGLVDKSALSLGVKILGDGDLDKKLTVALPVSLGAKAKIEKAGGKVVVKDIKVKKVKAVKKVKPVKLVKEIKTVKSKDNKKDKQEKTAGSKPVAKLKKTKAKKAKKTSQAKISSKAVKKTKAKK